MVIMVGKNRKLKIVKIGKYHPTQSEYLGGDTSDLSINLICSDKENKKVILNVKGINASFWVNANPYNYPDFRKLFDEYVIMAEKHGRSYVEGHELWRIYVKYPFHVPKVREFWKKKGIWTGLADLTYEKAFPIHYGITSRYIYVKKQNETNINISDIIVDKDRKQSKKMEFNNAFYDIETFHDGTIPVLSYVDDQENVFCATCFLLSDEDKMKIKQHIKDSKWLSDHTHITEDGVEVPPLGGEINIRDFSSEKEMLNYIFFNMENVSHIHNVIAWYAEFDKTGTEVRCIENEIEDPWENYNIIDIMPMYVRAAGLQSAEGRSALHWSSRQSLKYGKVIRTVDGKPNSKKIEIEDLANKDPVLLVIYNIWDSLLAKRINYYYNNLINQWSAYTDFCGLNISDWSDSAYLAEELIQLYVFGEGKILPTRGQNKYYHSIEGGYVKPPVVGLHKKCFELDITKTYPSIVISGNLSSETLVENPCDICANKLNCDKVNIVSKFLKDREDGIIKKKMIKKLEEEINTLQEESKQEFNNRTIIMDVIDNKRFESNDLKTKNKSYIDPHIPAKCPIDSFEPICDVSIFPSGRIYRKDIQSPVPRLLRELTIKRDEVRKLMKNVKSQKDFLRKTDQLTKEKEEELDNLYDIYYSDQFVKKEVMNSAGYGLFVYHKFRLADSRVGDDITDVARKQVWWNIDVVENYHPKISEIISTESDILINCNVIYSDTDGIKIIIKNLIDVEESIGRELLEEDLYAISNYYCKKVNSTYPEFALKVIGQSVDVSFEVKVESVMESFYIWGAKKNYIYKLYGGKIKKTGIGRSDKIMAFHELTDDMGKHILNDDLPSLCECLKEFEEKILSGGDLTLLGRPRGMRKKEDADGNVADSSKGFVEAMKYSNTKLGKNFKTGDKPVFYNNVIRVGKHNLPSNGMVALEYGDDPKDFGITIDLKRSLDDMIESQSVSHFLSPLGGWRKIRSGFKPQVSLDDVW